MTTLARQLPPRPAAAPEPAEATDCLYAAAQLGHAMAMNMAGRCHGQGWGTPADAGKVVHWYRQAVRLDLPEDRYDLANMLASASDGIDGLDGIARDHAEALHWLAKVPATATPRYLKQVGALPGRSPHAASRAVGERGPARSQTCDSARRV